MSETDTSPSGIQRALLAGLDKAISIHQPVVARHVCRIRRRHPEASRSDVIDLLAKQYLATVISTGAAAGGVAAAPGVGTAVAVALSAGEMASFLEASALFVLAVAQVHGLWIDDRERRRTLLLTVLLGNSGASFVEKAAGRTGKHWGKLLTDAIPTSSITKVNKVLGRWFVTKYGTKQGILVIGRLAPFGIGAGIGGAGNALLGRTVVAGVQRAFGPPGEWTNAGCDEEEQDSEPSASYEADDQPEPRTIRLNIYIYGLVDPRTHEVRYVGASLNPWRRGTEHLAEARSTSTTPKAVWLRDLLCAGLEPEVRILAQTSQAVWRDVEEKWIARYRNLTNSGGSQPEAPEIEDV